MYSGEVTLISLDPTVDSYDGRLVLNIRWFSDGSELTPYPDARTPAPAVASSGLEVYTAFTVNDDASGPHEYVFTVADDVDGTLLYRSVPLQTLPAIAQNHNGAFEVIRAAGAPTFAKLNRGIASKVPSSEGSTTISAATLAPSTTAGTVGLTAIGAHVISGPRGAAITFPFTYTAALKVTPNVDVFTPSRIVNAAVSGENITFTTPPGTPPLLTLTLGMISPAIARLLRSNIEPVLDQEIDDAIRQNVAGQLGLGSSWPPGATITLQQWNPTGSGIAVSACIGGVIPFLPPRGARGCAMAVPFVIGAISAAIRQAWFV